MQEVNRRDMLKTAAVSSLGVGLLGTLGAQAFAANKTPVAMLLPVTPAPYAVKPLPFSAKSLHGISEKVIQSHWENNYTSTVKALNAVEQKLLALMEDPNLPPYMYGDLKREQLIRKSSVILHELYFANLGGDGKINGEIQVAIEETYGNINKWSDEFKRTAMALAGGSGWVVLAYDDHAGRLCNYWAWDHSNSAPMSTPLLVLDMYEHAFHMDYGAAAAKYIDAFMNNIHWGEVNRRYSSHRKATGVQL